MSRSVDYWLTINKRNDMSEQSSCILSIVLTLAILAGPMQADEPSFAAPMNANPTPMD